MNCRYCGQDKPSLVLIPETPEAADITKSAFACMDCAIEQGIFCAKHDKVHQGFSGGKHGCWGCIAGVRQKLLPYAKEAVELIARLLVFLPEDDRELFFDEGELELAAINPSKAEICFEFLAREIVLNGLEPDGFIKKFLLSSVEPEELADFAKRSLPQRHLTT